MRRRTTRPWGAVPAFRDDVTGWSRGTGATPAVCVGVLGTVMVLLALVPVALTAQKWPALPVEDESALSAVEERLWYYYVTSQRGALSISPFGAFCNADRGEWCYEGDHESFCRKFRCKRRSHQAEFVDDLGEIAAEHPHSVYTVGHAVYAAVRMDFPEKASGFLELCRPGGRWWCDLLEGYVLHRTRRSLEAEPHFRRGLAAAPPEIRCRLEDVSYLLPGERRDEYEATPCGVRDALHRHFWWLTDPFFMDPGNDRWAEHVSRRFTLMLHEHRIIVAQRVPPPNDFRDIVHTDIHENWVVARGHQDSWDLRRVGAESPLPGLDELRASGGADAIRASDRLEARPSNVATGPGTPDAVGLGSGSPEDDPFSPSGGDDWPERAGYRSLRGSASHYAPDAFSFDGLEGLSYWVEAELHDEAYTRPDGPTGRAPAQVARFREGDSLIVALASELGRVDFAELASLNDTLSEKVAADSLPPGQAFLALSEGPDHVASLDPVPLRDRLVFATPVPEEPLLVGLEAFTPSSTARHRSAVLPLGAERALSDILLFRRRGELPETRMQAIGTMLGSTDVPVGRDLGVYWEAYGVEPETEVEMTLRFEGGGGALEWLGRTLGIGDESGGISWSETTGSGDVFRQAITVGLQGLDEGSYEMVLEMRLPDGEVLRRTRSLVVFEDEG